MAHYCINPDKADKCEFVYKGVVIFTDENADKTKKLCNIYSEDKPCFRDLEQEKRDLEAQKKT